MNTNIFWHKLFEHTQRSPGNPGNLFDLDITASFVLLLRDSHPFAWKNPTAPDALRNQKVTFGNDTLSISFIENPFEFSVLS